ncbi:hypothetical protein BC567DRAFT_225864 [Phyllosticta citribraziliensis]
MKGLQVAPSRGYGPFRTADTLGIFAGSNAPLLLPFGNLVPHNRGIGTDAGWILPGSLPSPLASPVFPQHAAICFRACQLFFAGQLAPFEIPCASH